MASPKKLLIPESHPGEEEGLLGPGLGALRADLRSQRSGSLHEEAAEGRQDATGVGGKNLEEKTICFIMFLCFFVFLYVFSSEVVFFLYVRYHAPKSIGPFYSFFFFGDY